MWVSWAFKKICLCFSEYAVNPKASHVRYGFQHKPHGICGYHIYLVYHLTWRHAMVGKNELCRLYAFSHAMFSTTKKSVGTITHQELPFTILNGIRMIYNLSYRNYFILFITIKGHNCTIHPTRNRCALRGHRRSHGKVDLPPTSCEGVESLGTQPVIRYGDESWE